MKNIVLTAASHMAAAECEGIEFERGIPRLVDDAKAEAILRNEWFAEVPPEIEKPADKPAPAPFAARAPEPIEPAK